MFFKTNESHGLAHHPFKACVVPRPIGWISTRSKDGIDNLAPFSFFNGVAQNPPQVMVAVNGKSPHADSKDTLANIRETGEFCISIATYNLRKEMFLSASPLEPNISEAEKAGLELAESALIQPGRVKESPISMECRLTQTIDLLCDSENEKNTMILGHVIGMHIDDAVLTDGKVDMDKVNPISRLGYKDYATLGEIFQMDAAWRKG